MTSRWKKNRWEKKPQAQNHDKSNESDGKDIKKDQNDQQKETFLPLLSLCLVKIGGKSFLHDHLLI